MNAQGAASIDVRPDVQQAFVDEVDERLQTSVWNTGGCNSYYLSGEGRDLTFTRGSTAASARGPAGWTSTTTSSAGPEPRQSRQ